MAVDSGANIPEVAATALCTPSLATCTRESSIAGIALSPLNYCKDGG
jgi:hypothetical protein